MDFSAANQTASLSVGEFADFALGPRDSGGGAGGLWRAQLGQHWHNELRRQTEQEHAATDATGPAPQFEIVLSGTLTHRGWGITLTGRIDQEQSGILREIKTVSRTLPADEAGLRADYPAYFLQLATYARLRRQAGAPPVRCELVFVEASSGLAQAIALTAFDEALVTHQIEALVQFLELQARGAARRRQLCFHSPFPALRPGQETIQQDLAGAFAPPVSQEIAASGPPSEIENPKSKIVLLEAPTGYGKTGCALEFALGQLRDGRFDRLVWLTGKSTGQLQVVETLRRMTAPTAGDRGVCNVIGYKPDHPPVGTDQKCNLLGYTSTGPLAFWQVRNKGEHCVNTEFHCVRDSCDYLAGAVERWPLSGLARFHLDESQPRDLDALRAAGREARVCPYEITRTALAFNDVWIGDYNYVFAPDNRGLFFDQPGFDPARTLLVIDEAHNLPSRVADAHSHHATDADARALLAELDHLRAPPALLLAVESWARLLASIGPCDELDGADEEDLRDTLDRLAELVATTPLDYAALGPHHCETLWSLPRLREFLDDRTLRRLLWCRRPGELEFTCIDAAAAIGETLRNFGGTLLMSATLAPFESFAAACGLVGRVVPDEPRLTGTDSPAYSTLRAPAPWRHGAYDVAVDLRLATTLRERESHYGTTAETVATVQAAAGRAVAVFFPSYAYAESVLQAIERGGHPLRVMLQPKLPDLAAQSAWVEEALALADALFLVLGSSFAESIDLLGGRVTHAVVVGPALPEVNAVQKARLAVHAGLGRDAAFRRVYQIPGLQKVNQALGRLVRGPGHHAKILLHCRRFGDPSYAALLDPECQFYREIANQADLDAWLRGE